VFDIARRFGNDMPASAIRKAGGGRGLAAPSRGTVCSTNATASGVRDTRHRPARMERSGCRLPQLHGGVPMEVSFPTDWMRYQVAEIYTGRMVSGSAGVHIPNEEWTA
tara:strand:+ start:3024 stop:3347 length:324 start_codon:yes stop_codon:yes gene_type:complete